MPTEFTPFATHADGASGLSRSRIRNSKFRKEFHGVRIDARAPQDLATRSLAVAVVLSDTSFLCGPSAAILLGLPLPWRLEHGPVHIAAREEGAHLARAGAVGRRLDVSGSELIRVDGVLMTSPARTFCDLAKDLSIPGLCAVGDALLRDHGVTAEELTRTMLRRLRYSGKVKARNVIPMLDARAESAQESRCRAILISSGFASPVPQFVVRDEYGQIFARIDLAYPELRIAIEYDGDVHRSKERFRRDASRRTMLRAQGWYVVEVTADDVRYPPRLLRKVSDAIRYQSKVALPAA